MFPRKCAHARKKPGGKIGLKHIVMQDHHGQLPGT